MTELLPAGKVVRYVEEWKCQITHIRSKVFYHVFLRIMSIDLYSIIEPKYVLSLETASVDTVCLQALLV